MAHPTLHGNRKEFGRQSIANQRSRLRYYVLAQIQSPASLTSADNAEFEARLQIYAKRTGNLASLVLSKLRTEAYMIADGANRGTSPTYAVPDIDPEAVIKALIQPDD